MQLCCALWLCFCVYLPCVAESLVKPYVECAFLLWCASVFIDGPLAFKLAESFGVWRARHAGLTVEWSELNSVDQ